MAIPYAFIRLSERRSCVTNNKSQKTFDMKKLFTLIILLALVTAVTGQSGRLVLIEEATNASCPPCASQNPAFDNLLNQNRDILTAVKYHWYFPGYDPMHNHNPDENNARVSYYGISGVPTATIDGDIPNGPTFSYPGGPHGYTQQLIDDYAAVPSPFNLTLSHSISQNEDSIYVHMMIEATENVSGMLKGHMVVVEKEINFSSPPGSNGETHFLDVMKKMIPGATGTLLPDFETGDYMILSGSWAMQNVYNMDEVGVVGFVQDDDDKTVHQAGNGSTEPLVPLYTTDVSMLEIGNVAERNCLGVISPEITIRNNGSADLNSVDVFYHVNGEETFTYSWSGDLSFLETATVQLPEVGFTVEEENDLVVYTANPNGTTDEYPGNDTMHRSVPRSRVTPETINFLIRTDDNPEENTWEIANPEGEIIFSGGPYAEPNTMYSEELVIPAEDCYIFRMYDSGGDGLTLPAFYALYFGGSNYIATGTDFGAVDSAYFMYSTSVRLPEVAAGGEVRAYPNPFTDNVTVAATLTQPGEVQITVTDILGNVLYLKDYGMYGPGEYQFRIPTGSWAKGIYFLNFVSGKQRITEKLLR